MSERPLSIEDIERIEGGGGTWRDIPSLCAAARRAHELEAENERIGALLADAQNALASAITHFQQHASYACSCAEHAEALGKTG